MSDDKDDISQALRMRDAWLLHRDKLARMTEKKQYNMVNRQTINKAVQTVVAAMDAAQEGNDG